MATICGKISADLLVDCTNPIVNGANDRLILINQEDWEDATITYNGTNTKIIENIILPSATTGYEYQGMYNSNEPKSTLVKGTYSTSWDQEVMFKIFNNSPDVKKQLDLLRLGKVVAIIQNNHKGTSGNAAFEVYGHSSGLELVECTRTVADNDTQGGYACVLRNSEKSRENSLPYSIFITSYSVTKALVDSLIA